MFLPVVLLLLAELASATLTSSEFKKGLIDDKICPAYQAGGCQKDFTASWSVIKNECKNRSDPKDVENGECEISKLKIAAKLHCPKCETTTEPSEMPGVEEGEEVPESEDEPADELRRDNPECELPAGGSELAKLCDQHRSWTDPLSLKKKGCNLRTAERWAALKCAAVDTPCTIELSGQRRSRRQVVQQLCASVFGGASNLIDALAPGEETRTFRRRFGPWVQGSLSVTERGKCKKVSGDLELKPPGSNVGLEVGGSVENQPGSDGKAETVKVEVYAGPCVGNEVARASAGLKGSFVLSHGADGELVKSAVFGAYSSLETLFGSVRSSVTFPKDAVHLEVTVNRKHSGGDGEDSIYSAQGQLRFLWDRHRLRGAPPPEDVDRRLPKPSTPAPALGSRMRRSRRPTGGPISRNDTYILKLELPIDTAEELSALESAIQSGNLVVPTYRNGEWVDVAPHMTFVPREKSTTKRRTVAIIAAAAGVGVLALCAFAYVACRRKMARRDPASAPSPPPPAAANRPSLNDLPMALSSNMV